MNCQAKVICMSESIHFENKKKKFISFVLGAHVAVNASTAVEWHE